MAAIAFDDAGIFEVLCGLDEAALDELTFGVIGLDAANVVEIYNICEQRNAGLSKARIVGQHFFLHVAPCMNNYLVAERIDTEVPLDITIPYVLTFRMKPTPVRLRLLRAPDVSRRWVLIARD
jgi:photoactive yellow protein